MMTHVSTPNLPNAHRFTHITPIHKGWSDDKKYCIYTQDNQKLLLRLTSIDKLTRKKAEYEAMQRILQTGIPMSIPLEIGTCLDAHHVYTLLSWIEGEDARIILPTLSPNDQYQLGRLAGNILKTIHTIPAPTTQPLWDIYFNQKIDRQIASYKQCGIAFEGDTKMLDYIQAHRHLLEGRPQTMQHGDYHVGNMVIDEHLHLSIIDFNRFDYGDPWEEFNRLVWCVDASKYFAAGRVDGYFDDDVPYLFWQLMTLYISSNTLASIPWAIPFGESEIEVMLRQANMILKWYDGMKHPIPHWYTEVNNSLKPIYKIYPN